MALIISLYKILLVIVCLKRNGGESTVGCNAYERNRMRMLEFGGMYYFDSIASIFQVKEKKKTHTHTHSPMPYYRDWFTITRKSTIPYI